MARCKPITHGTASGYRRGCHCAECRNAKYAYDIKKGWRRGMPKRSRKEERVYRYAEQYGVSVKTVRLIGADQLDRMADHARATMFSTLKWDKAHPYWKQGGVKPEYKPRQPRLIAVKKPTRTEKEDARVERMMQAVDRLFAMRRVAA